MTKAEIVSKIAKKTGVEKTVVALIVDTFTQEVKDALSVGRNVYLRGFGSFIRKQRKAKTARNIKEHTTIIVPEHEIPAFRPAQEFVDIVKGTK